jgi:hypothetical protein
MVLKQGFTLIMIGVAVGLFASQIWGIHSVDLWTFSPVVVFMYLWRSPGFSPASYYRPVARLALTPWSRCASNEPSRAVRREKPRSDSARDDRFFAPLGKSPSRLAVLTANR